MKGDTMQEQATLGSDWATDKQLSMAVGGERGVKVPLADPEKLKARQRRRDLEAQGQRGMF